MATGSRRSFRGGRRVRPGGGWGRVITGGNIAAASTKLLIGSFTLSNPDINETVRRTVGLLQVFSDQIIATEDQVGAFGMCVVMDTAIAAGVASLPGPVTEANDNIWFVWQPVLQGLEFLTGVGFLTAFDRHYPIDSKAMRKVEEGQSVAMIAESTAGSDGWSINVGLSMYSTRTARV